MIKCLRKFFKVTTTAFAIFVLLIQKISYTLLNDSSSQANQSYPSDQFFSMWREHIKSSLSKFQVNNTALLTMVTILYISCLGIYSPI